MNATPRVELPWLRDAEAALGKMAMEDRVPPALLIRGVSGTGKTQLALDFAQRLLCRSPLGAKACGSCASCHLFAAKTHPDFLHLAPEDPRKAIKVDSVRQMIQALALTPQYGGYRVVLIDQAEGLNANAANALLKTLEEPPLGTLLILVTDQPGRLPQTVRSRMRLLNVALPERRLSLAWLSAMGRPDQDLLPLLNAANGSPLRALTLDANQVIKRRSVCFSQFLAVFEGLSDPLEVAESWVTDALELELDWMANWFRDLLYLAMGLSIDTIHNLDFAEGYGVILRHAGSRFLMESYGRLLEAKGELPGPSNRQLLLEGLFLPWAGPHPSLV